MTNIIHEYPEFLEITEDITVETLNESDDHTTFLVRTYSNGETIYSTPRLDD